MKGTALFSNCRSSLTRFRQSGGAALILCLLAVSTYARLTAEDLAVISETGLVPLTGEQEGKYAGRDYVVVETMRIKRGDTVTFAPGTRLFFHPNARMIINGTLHCKGSPANPITVGKLPFSLPKLSSEMMVFDNTSIFVYRGGGLYLRHTHLADSSVRVRLTDMTSAFAIDTVTCTGNRFMLPDTSLLFPPKAIVTCTNERGAVAGHCGWVLPAEETKAPPARRFHLTPLVAVRIALGVGSAAAAGVGAYYYRKAGRTAADYRAETNPSSVKQYRESNNAAVRRYNLAVIAGACGIAAFSITFTIGGHRQ
ncbi:MAG: hypothetical protein JXA18_17125 [Chitinispirillaceae bacterium]|nr:hypothetical protein [Chitinispirillaceae bacterium]